MKPHPRIRKAVKWGGAVVSVLLVVVWVGSGWWWFTLSASFSSHGIYSGRLYIGPITTSDPPTSFMIRPASRDSRGNMDWGFGPYNTGSGWQCVMPLWPLAGVSVFVTALAWRLDILARRRARMGLCPKCSYNRAGLAPGAVCPECGAAAIVSAPVAS